MIKEELQKLSFQHPIILYDGQCMLCNKVIQKIIKWDKEEKVRYAMLQSAYPDVENLSTVCLLYKGDLKIKSDALVALFRIINKRGLARALGLFPKVIRDFGYQIVANNRFLFWKKSETCLIPDRSQKRLFIE